MLVLISTSITGIYLLWYRKIESYISALSILAFPCTHQILRFSSLLANYPIDTIFFKSGHWSTKL